MFPVSTGLIVQGLARPEYLMEIEVSAVIPEERMAKTKTKAKAKVKSGRGGKGKRK